MKIYKIIVTYMPALIICRIATLLKNNNKIKNGMQRPIFRMTAKIWVKYKKPIVLFQLIYNTDNHLHKYFLLDKNNKFDKKDY